MLYLTWISSNHGTEHEKEFVISNGKVKINEEKQNKKKNKISSGTEYITVVMTIKNFSPLPPLCEGSLLLYGCAIPPHFHN